MCIARKNDGAQLTFTVRKISYGEGVERVFPLYSPRIEGIDVVRRGDVRRAKLYYLRGRTGKAARIAEKTGRPAPPRPPERGADRRRGRGDAKASGPAKKAEEPGRDRRSRPHAAGDPAARDFRGTKPPA